MSNSLKINQSKNPREIPEELLSQLSGWIAEEMGLNFPQKRWNDLERIINQAGKVLEFDNIERFAGEILASSLNKNQRETLLQLFSIGETYFFREKTALNIFEQHILQKLIQSRKSGKKKLKIWCAACSSGEEPYTLAIIISRHLLDFRDWDISIIGTDINKDLLKKARNGIYRDWSFRDTDENIKKQYFVKIKEGQYQISPDIKRMATFSHINLVKSPFHNSPYAANSILNNTDGIDVIFCRNVFIYFTPQQIDNVVNKLYGSLVDGGYLIVSPTETSSISHPKLVDLHFPGCALFKKDVNKSNVIDNSGIKTDIFSDGSFTGASSLDLPELSGPTSFDALSTTKIGDDFNQPETLNAIEEDHTKDYYSKALNLYKNGSYDEAIRLLHEFIAHNQDCLKAFTLLAKACANLGKFDDALKWNDKALKQDKMNPICHYLKASILQEQGRHDDVVKSLKRTIYLDHEFVLAHFMLGSLCNQQGKSSESEKHFKNTRTILNNYKSNEILPHSEGMTAGRLAEIINSLTQNRN